MGDNNHLNLVMLGSDNLTTTLERQVKSVCNSDDEFLHQDEIFSLDYRCVSGDVSLPENAFRTQDFLPHGKPITNHTFRLSHLQQTFRVATTKVATIVVTIIFW